MAFSVKKNAWLLGATMLCIPTVACDQGGVAVEPQALDSMAQAAIVSSITEGDYVIRSAMTSKCLDVSNGSTADGAKVQEWDCNGSAAQTFRLTPTTDGYWKFINAASGKALDIKDASTAQNAILHQWSYVNATNQQFRFVSRGNNQFSFHPRHTDMAIDLYWGSADNGTQLVQYPYTGGANQHWTFDKIGGSTGGGTTGKWVQIWADEFNGSGVDGSNWNVVTDVHVNNEQQQYTTSGQNIAVNNGTLKLTARYQPTNGYPYTSGRLESGGKRQFTHGAVEARIKMPVGPGLWPAFWMLGNDIGSVGWPSCGELDIMENVGYGDWISAALHGPGYSGANPIDAGRHYPNSSVSNFHTYRTEYSPTEIKWLLDGVLVKTVSKSQVTSRGAWVYDKPLFIILNLAVGGAYPQGVNGASSPYPGVPQSTADLIRNSPQTMEVDWVRAYQWQ